LNLQDLLQKSLLALLLLPTLILAADRVGDFSLLDQNGYFHQMSWYDDNKAIVLLVQATGDIGVQNVLADFDSLNSSFDAQGIEFFMINPLGLKDRDAVKAEMVALNIDVPVLMDDARLISEALDIDKIGEVIVYDPKSFSVLFRGPLGAELTTALTNIVADRDLQTTQVASTGTPVNYPIKTAHLQQVPSYEKEIGPIIAQNCAACHREGGIAPFALDSHTMVMGWSQMIREVLMTKRMPPGQIDSHIGDFINDMVLVDEDAQKIVHWIEAGSPKDGITDPLTALVWPETEWAFGEPDYIVEIPEQSIPATGILDYYNVMVELDLEEDRWVRASQYIPGDRTVLHHTLHSLVAPGETRGGSLLGGEPDRPDIAPYIPGQAPRMEPPNTGGLLKAGTRIAMQMHYTTTGKESVDASRIGIWFYPKGFIPEERMTGQCACHFTPTWVNIPPLDPDYEMTQSFTIEKDAKLCAFPQSIPMALAKN
jgi:hypothetical protein